MSRKSPRRAQRERSTFIEPVTDTGTDRTTSSREGEPAATHERPWVRRSAWGTAVLALLAAAGIELYSSRSMRSAITTGYGVCSRGGQHAFSCHTGGNPNLEIVPDCDPTLIRKKADDECREETDTPCVTFVQYRRVGGRAFTRAEGTATNGEIFGGECRNSSTLSGRAEMQFYPHRVGLLKAFSSLDTRISKGVTFNDGICRPEHPLNIACRDETGNPCTHIVVEAQSGIYPPE